MRTWLSSILLVVTGAFAAASGCGNPDVVNNDSLFVPDGSVGGNGSGASGGSFSLGDGGSSANACPSTCDELNADCGEFVTDTKCGNTINCGSTCPKGEVCGGTEPNRCGVSSGTTPDGGNCTPRTCDELGITCGAAIDPKCPGDPLDCGDSCPDNCTHGTCTTTACVVDPATTCAGLSYTCGQAIDNCGHVLDCATKTCDTGEICMQGVCTTPPACIPTTCAALGYTCGQAGDGCGHKLDCGSTTCPIPGQTCGGGGTIGQCGCTGACSQIPTCPTAGVTTTLSGKVYDPAGRNPLYHALVYIANDPTDPNLKTFPAGITCDVCGSNAAGSPLVSTPGATDPPAGEYSGVDGSFTLKNVPVGNVTIVIQLGRWRRTFAINVPNACAPNTLPAALNGKLLMPATQAQGNIPLMAMVTGKVDSLECVLRKMGIDKSEFTDPADGGRVQFYAGTGSAGQTIDAATPTQDKLFTVTAGQPAINGYDMTILSCQGAAYRNLTDPNQAALRAYADGGGRVFATHYSYTWLDKNQPTPPTAGVTDNWNEVAQWHVDENDRSATDTTASPIIGLIDKVTNPKGAAFEGWLSAVGALNATPADSTTVYVVRHDTDFISPAPVATPTEGRTQQWLYRNGDNARKCATTGATCTGVGTGAGLCLAKVCSVATTVSCTSNANCSARVCSNRPGTTCNVNNDCRFAGGDNGTCNNNTCVDNSCNGTDYSGEQTPLHFTFNTPVNLQENLMVKPAVVQCGRVLFSDFHVSNANENGETFPQECGKGVSRVAPSAAGGGTCTTDAQCTGTCTANKCPWGTACTANADCASTCGGGGICLDPMNPQEKLLEFMIFDLGSCVPTTSCTAKTMQVACAGQNCGDAPDGCGNLIHCGDCPSGQSCGVGQPPVANVCGAITCPKQACPSTQECGYASDGCDSSILCGTCPAGKTCNNGKCGSTTCTPESCTDQGIECGNAGDQCGSLLTCPACPAKDTCIDGQCVPLTCVPQTCSDQKIQCGQAADGCGHMIASCGDCPAGDLCVVGQCVHVN
jgi:hypothetical protein